MDRSLEHNSDDLQNTVLTIKPLISVWGFGTAAYTRGCTVFVNVLLIKDTHHGILLLDVYFNNRIQFQISQYALLVHIT